MSDRLRNNVIAGFIVLAFWIVFVVPVMAADPIVTDSTSVVTTNGNQTTKVESPPPSAIAPQFGSGNNVIYVRLALVVQYRHRYSDSQ